MTSELQSLLAWCTNQEHWLRETIESLVRLESPNPGDGQRVVGLAECALEIATRLTAQGAVVDRPAAANTVAPVRAVFDGDGPRVLILGHFDTVWPIGQLARMPIREDDGRLHGPGIYDMKAGIGVAMLALRALDACAIHPRPRVVMLWTSDEEIGSDGCRPVLEAEARASDAVLVIEPSLPGGAAKTSRKGCGEFTIVVSGVASHAGLNPAAGASAIHELARQILEIERLHDLPNGVSVNVGIVTGGSRPNVVAESATAVVDVRAISSADADRVTRALTSLRPFNPRTRVEVTGGFDRPPLERTESVQRLYMLAREVAAGLGRDLPEGAAGGGSDGNFTAAAGVPTLDGLGPQGDGAHAFHEHVVLVDLPWRAAFLAGLLYRLAVDARSGPDSTDAVK